MHKPNPVATARVFKSGNSQAVRLPKEFRFRSSSVEIYRRGGEVVLRERAPGLRRAFEILTGFPDDFFEEGRRELPPQKRRGL